MRLSREGLSIGPGTLWLSAWVLWLATAAALPFPPWKSQDVLALEERIALELAGRPTAGEVWSTDVGGSYQAGSLGRGWDVPEAFLEDGRRRTFAWIEGEAAEVGFASPGWEEAQLCLRAFPLPTLAPLAVEVLVDSEPRGRLVLQAGWTVAHTPIGRVGPGPHVVTLRPERRERPPGEARRLSLALDGLAVGATAVADPHRDRGVFAGWLRVGLSERPALFLSPDAAAGPLPPGTARREVAPGLLAWYGFGVGGEGGAASAAIEALHGLAAAALLCLLPGLVWTGLLRARGAARLGLSLALSTVVLVVVFVALRVIGPSPTPLSVGLGVALAGSLPLPFLRGRGRLELPWRALLPGAIACIVLTYFAAAVVPPLEDQDMEVQATAHALATRQAPTALTNRGTTSFFAHPPLLHLWQAGSFALSGRLGRVAYYEEAARQAAARSFVEPEPGAPRPHLEEWRGLLRRFLAEPQLWPTRQVNVLLAAVAVGLVAQLAAALSGSLLAGLGLALTLVTLPEFLIRGAYGGYFASTALLSLLVVAALNEGAGASALMTTSALAFLANQKGLLVPAGWALAAPAATRWRRLLPLAGGAIGLLAFAAYGLAVDSAAFLYDFVKEHLVRRLAPTDVRFAADAARAYPSIPELWAEFVGRYGLVVTSCAALASLKGLRSARPAVRAASASVLLGAVVFSLTDWRQTKHLSLLAAPALLAIAGAWPKSPWGRRLAYLLLAVAIATNLRSSWPLLTSFEALRPGTIW